MSNTFLESPVVQQKALQLAESYHQWQQAKKTAETHADDAQATLLATQTKQYASQLFTQAQAIRGPIRKINTSFRTTLYDGIISADNPTTPGMANEYVNAEDDLKKTLNFYVAGIAKENHYLIPESNAYYGEGRLRY